MDILIVNTGDDKLDTAYKNLQVHISSFDNFHSFYSYFNEVVKTDNKEYLNKWLLKVLFCEFKYGRVGGEKHKFDLLLEKVGADKKEQLEKWLDDNLEKVT